jgi:DNA-binding LacI/PurR family transcriptional regulator
LLVQHASTWSPEEGRAAARHLLSAGTAFTAVFAQSDLLALGAIAELRDAGLRVPEDVSIIGYDDIPVASYIQPPLTTMRQPIRDLGALAARLLIHAIAESRPGEVASERHRLLKPELVMRESVAPPSDK